eukprot:gene14771-16309_t
MDKTSKILRRCFPTNNQPSTTTSTIQQATSSTITASSISHNWFVKNSTFRQSMFTSGFGSFPSKLVHVHARSTTFLAQKMLATHTQAARWLSNAHSTSLRSAGLLARFASLISSFINMALKLE